MAASWKSPKGQPRAKNKGKKQAPPSAGPPPPNPAGLLCICKCIVCAANWTKTTFQTNTNSISHRYVSWNVQLAGPSFATRTILGGENRKWRWECDKERECVRLCIMLDIWTWVCTCVWVCMHLCGCARTCTSCVCFIFPPKFRTFVGLSSVFFKILEALLLESLAQGCAACGVYTLLWDHAYTYALPVWSEQFCGACIDSMNACKMFIPASVLIV